MQAAQLKEEFSRIEQRIDNAATACQISNDVPEELRACLGELDRESDQVRQVIETESNDNRIRQCVDRLEKLGDRAMHACSQENNVDARVQEEVKQAHDAISGLKRRLHH